MAYQIKWDERAYRELKKINTKDAVDILNSITSLYKESYKAGKSLSGKFKGKFRLKVKEYRVIYWIEETPKCIWILSVKHRKDVYR